MNRLEVIHLRCLTHKYNEVHRMIKELIRDGNSSMTLAHMKIYSRRNLSTDISFHIHYSAGDRSQMDTAGIKIASALKGYGLVRHTIWDVLEMDHGDADQMQF